MRERGREGGGREVKRVFEIRVMHLLGAVQSSAVCCWTSCVLETTEQGETPATKIHDDSCGNYRWPDIAHILSIHVGGKVLPSNQHSGKTTSSIIFNVVNTFGNYSHTI